MGDSKLTVSAAGGPEALATQMSGQGLNRSGTRVGVAKLAGSRFDPDGLRLRIVQVCALRPAN